MTMGSATSGFGDGTFVPSTGGRQMWHILRLGMPTGM